MKLVVIIPAYNEADSLGSVIRAIPRTLPGMGSVRVIVVDDGSEDATPQCASDAGADRVVRNGCNLGLARTFHRGIDAALRDGADCIVNIDADGQYDPAEIEKLIEPILSGTADITIGDRQVSTLHFMKAGNKYGNIFGSWALRVLTGTPVRDASSGFRAFSREAALRLTLFFHYTYTHEIIIQAVYKGIRMMNVPITFRPRNNGVSKLISGLFQHVKKTSVIILRTILLYRPLKVLMIAGCAPAVIGLVVASRFIYFFLQGDGSGRIQSLILSAILIITGILLIVLGLIGDLVANNRKLEEEILYYLKRREYSFGEQED